MLLEKYWPQGIQQCQQSDGAIEYKLSGYPFQQTWSDTDSESLQAQIMCGYFLKELLTQGWTLVASSDLSRDLEHTAWFFRRSTPIVLDQRYTNIPNFTVSKDDRLIFFHLNQQMQRELIALINTTYRKGVQEVLQLGSDGVRIKLNGYPWLEKWKLENEARPLLLAVLQYFEQRGYYFYGNASLQGQTDTVYFMPLTLPWPLRINPPLEPASENRYFAIGLDRKDRLRLLNCPDIVLDNIIELTILQFWPKGIQNKKQISNWFEYKLAGYPWCASGYETVEARLLLTQIFQNLHMHGWAIMAALDTSRSLDDTSFLIFRSTPSRSMHYMCLSLDETDKIRLINAPSDVVKVVHDAIQTDYTYGIQRFENYGSVPEFKLNGSPWVDVSVIYTFFKT
uniref:Uncharacterized protein n=1 Tax=Acrobeloides nanus TaxID=290746 RepID=A0A914E4R9_9BILA